MSAETSTADLLALNADQLEAGIHAALKAHDVQGGMW